MAENLKKCFVVAPIGADGSKERQHSDDVLDLIINPVLTTLGFEEGKRADHLGMPGDITRQILDRIVNDDLVIADLTGHNPNVFYELAIRHVARKPYIHVIKNGEKIPFDIAPQRTVFIDPEKPRDIERAKKELAKQVETCMADGFEVESPVSLTLAVDRLKEGSDTDRSIAVLLEQVEFLVNRERLRDLDAALTGSRVVYGGPQGPQGAQAYVYGPGAVAPSVVLRGGHTLEELVKLRIKAVLAGRGVYEPAPPAIVGEVLAAVNVESDGIGVANLGELDRIAGAIIEQRLLKRFDETR